jgi:hypothetical protein
MTLWRALKSWFLEHRIQRAWERVLAAQANGADYPTKRALWDELVRLHSMRIVEQVERLERERGLR